MSARRPDVVMRAPAVSTPNAKIESAGGSSGSSGAGYQAGAIALPLGTDFGFQADALIGERATGQFAGGAGHFFWRDPAIGSMGVYGSLSYFDGPLAAQSTQTSFFYGKGAATAEAYFGRWTFEGLAGFDAGGFHDTDLYDFGRSRDQWHFSDQVDVA